MSNNRIEINALWEATDGGKPVILHYYPQAAVGFAGRKNFRLRPDDKSPSAVVFLSKEDGGKFWFIQDKGGTDTKARNAVTLVQEREGLDFAAALRWIAERFAPRLLSGGSVKPVGAQPKIERSPAPLEHMRLGLRRDETFTEQELKILGHEITAESCKELNLKPLDYYITKKNEKGKSWVISATPEYPMFYLDCGDFGKIYQPLGEVRFMYYGEKPKDHFFGDVKVARLLLRARNGTFPEAEGSVDERIEQLIICSGPSDALNVSAHGYHVCWANSETEPIDGYTAYLLRKIAKQIYILYDNDATGRLNANRLALKYLDFNIVWLPEDLCRFKDRVGKPCKDAKDFFSHYRTPKHGNPKKHFDTLVKTSQSLKFWMDKFDKQGNPSGFDIDNEQLYGFLQANGVYKIATNINRKGYAFCHIKDNIVSRIDENDFAAYINNLLVTYVKENPEYYSKTLLNAIHRSNQVKLASLEKVKVGEFDFKSYGGDFDFFFFKNTAVRVTKDAVFPYKAADVGKYVYDFKIIDHHFELLDPPFDVSYSKKYLDLKKRLETAKPHTPEWDELKLRLDGLDDTYKYDLNIYDADFSFLKYVYNTGRVYWKKEEAGGELSEEEKREQDLFFISKVCALGYLLFRYKEQGQAYLVYAMETEQSSLGTHNGGTGKSILLNAIEHCRKQLFIDGQKPDIQNSEHLFSGVERGVTETVLFDDISEQVDLHRFLNTITGKMEVRALYQNTEVIPFEESPKVCATSNHGLRNFDSSIRRRTWFAAFTDYYHPEDRMLGRAERSPFTEFGKNLISDYTDEEMNRFYNFMARCLHTYLKFRRRVQPPMAAIEKRNIQRAIGDEFIFWADEWFTPDKLNANIEKAEAFEAYKATMPEKFARSIKSKTFTARLIQYCQYMGYTYTPQELLKSETEKKRNEIREYRDGKDIYCFHIRANAEAASAPAPLSGNSTNEITDGGLSKNDEPPF